MAGCTRVLWASTCGLMLASCGGGEDDAPPVDCSVFAAAAVSPYLLPWHVGQTYVGYPHLTWDPTVQRYAIDAPMPIGTDVLAMRSGTVVRVQESFFDNDLTPGHENYVYVQHDDGTVARYFHLTHDGALPLVGDIVRQGEPIARSGHTGNSSAPHLHFDVTRSCCAEPPAGNAMPTGETLPLSFAHATPDSSCGIVEGVSYTAQP
jgi:hypothetical protein